ncbi:hypothetical protein [uncultured Hymenobacter sp.]|uniref:hypothetical protein n=1 Tax=uncultured Hymenobacter sp. TaxID=170016 RepID=UPI0035CC8863
MRYVFLVLILLTVATFGTYTYLGGLREPTVALETIPTPLLLAGQPYHGLVAAEQFGQLFRRAKAAQEGGRLGGPTPSPLANLYFNDPETARDSVRAFIGLAVADSSQPLPPGFRYRLVPAGQRVVAARLRGVSYLLAPNKLYPAAFDLIKQRKLTRRPFYLEQFGPEEGVGQVWVGVQ